nr:hypothetical protein [Thiocapsa sp. KS1]
MKTKKPGGGTATGGGINFQAAVTAIAGAHLLRGTPLGWFPVRDVPVAVWAESEGAGDDVRLEFSPDISAEVQAKKGLKRNAKLWEALDALIMAVRDGHLDYGMLVVAPDSSGTIREHLAKDIERIGQGRHDNLSGIGTELLKRLQRRGGSWEQACQRVSIRVVNALKGNEADIKAAKESLRWVCADDRHADAAWNALYVDAVQLIQQRGRWTMNHLLKLLQRDDITIRDADFPAAIASKLANWVCLISDSFALPAVRKRLPLSALLEMRVVGTVIEQPDAEDAAAALSRYHDAAGALDRDGPIYDAEWTGRFRRHAVVVAGPGLGKSTLMTLLSNRYAADGFPVLSVELKRIAAAIEHGDSFDHALRSQALDGSGITADSFDRAKLKHLVVLADGLDDCGGRHDAVARALYTFASGHPSARIVVTTRPIGYATAALADWKHYRLLPPEKNQGTVNLARLLRALKGSDGINDDDDLQVATRELASSRAADAISTTPYLLGMAAALISSRGKLPDTRPRLYGEIIRLFETSGGAAASRSVSAIVAVHVLNALGWLLMHNPLAATDELTNCCAELLVEPMGCTRMTALMEVEPALRYWEQIGIIERLHHEGTAYWTFVHKTLTEFMAARHLMALPDEHRAAALDRLVDQPDWHEVIAFAGGLGLGDEIARLFVDRRAAGHPGQMERALAFAGDSDAEVSCEKIRELAELAFKVVESGAGDRFGVGLALAELAEVHPAIIGPIADARLYDERSSVQLVAWASALAAEPDGYGAVELAQVLMKLLPKISKVISGSLLGGIRFSFKKDVDLIERIALAALAAQPDAGIKVFAETYLDHKALDTIGFHIKVAALLRARGVAEDVDLPWARSLASSAFTLTNPTDEWGRACAKALRALAEAVGETGGTSAEPQLLLQFGALIALIGFNQVPAGDVHQWEEPYDAAAVRTVLHALVHASEIDPQALSAEAAAVMRRVDADDRLRPFDLDLPHVDVPEPDWHKAASLVSDRSTLVVAMNHGSAWMACIAGNILAASSATEEQSRSLLDDARGTSLWAAVEVVREQQPVEIANALILDRLAGSLLGGAEYLFNGLRSGKVMLSQALSEAIQRGLASPSRTIAIAAANLAKDLAERGQPIEPKLILDAYDQWRVRELKQESRSIATSPRETLMKLLISQNAFDDDRLLDTLSDTNPELCRAGEEHMLDAITMSQPIHNAVIDRIISRNVPAEIAARILRRETLLSEEQIRRLETLLREEDPKWRLVGVELLRRSYLSADQIAEHGARLSADGEDEIRQAVEQRLAAATGISLV